MVEVIVKKSKIQGWGVFASRNFKKGEVIIKWDTSQKLSKGMVDKLPEEEKIHVVYLNRKYILMQPPARYAKGLKFSNKISLLYIYKGLKFLRKFMSFGICQSFL